MQDSITLENGDIVTYPINEGTKNERLTIGRISVSGITYWIDGPEISSMVSDPTKCNLIAHKSKRADKIFKKYEAQFEKVDREELAFDLYESYADVAYERYLYRFKELSNE